VELKEGLEELGITDIFSFETADFTGALEGPACITGARQSLRVAIDEKGVTAAAYIEIPGAGAAAPPEEIIDFILDRPFVFVIATSQGVPLFTGVVNQP
jgi:serine protease inhibitor